MQIKHIFFKYCLRYFIGFLIVLLACVPIIVVSHSIIERKVLESNWLRLEEGVNEIDQNISKMAFIDNIISANTHFNRLIHTDGFLLSNQYMDLVYARDQLSEFGYIYTFSPYFFVLFQNNDCYVSSYQCSEFFSKNYYPTFLNTTDQDGNSMDAKSFKDFLFQTSSSYVQLDSITYYQNSSAHTLTQPILYIPTYTSILSPHEKEYRLVFVLDSDVLMRRLLTEDSLNYGFVQIQDSKGNIIFRYGNEVSLLDNSSKTSGLISGVNDSYHLLSYQAEESGWDVTIGYPQSLITNEVSLLMNIIAFYILLGIFAVLILTLFYSYHQYSSVKKLFTVVPDDKKSLAVCSRNEYETLSRVFREITQNTHRYKVQLDQLDQQNRIIMLENLIVRGITTKEERAQFETFFSTSTDYFCVVLIKMNVPNPDDYQPTLLCIVEYLKANYPNDFVNVHSSPSDELFLLSLNPSDAPNVQSIRKLFQTIASALSDDTGTTFHIGISAIGTDIANINACYHQAKQVTQAFINEPKNIIEIYNIEINAVHENVVNPEFLTKLYNLLLCGEQDGIEKLFSRMITYYQKMPMQYEDQKPQIFYSIRNVIFSAGLHLSKDNLPKDFLPSYRMNDTIRMMSNRLLESASQICSLINRGHSDKRLETKDNILQYMEDHYSEVSLSISHVCRQMNISEKSLQQIMKEHTGETFAASLERIRVTHAAEYLLSTTWSNEKIAEATGFAAVSTFYRVFNKVMGMSPGSYRNTHAAIQNSSNMKS